MRSFFLLFLVFSSLCSAAQSTKSSFPITFSDSVRIVLENTKNVDAAVIGGGFAAIYSSLSADQQQGIRKHVTEMRRRKYSLKPHLVNYFGAVVNAMSVEKIDPAKFGKYLYVAGKVIENSHPTKANNFFALSRTFFMSHSLHDEKSFQLRVTDDQYTFEYIAPPTVPDLNDTTALEADTVALEEEEDEDDWNSDPSTDTVMQEVMPVWMTPPPPPYFEGPVLNFDRATFQLITPYDSVEIRNTKGKVSLADNVFVGEGGSFDWTAAGLSRDSVICEFGTYFFNIGRCELDVPLVKLNYTNKTPGFIPGNFEFRSQARPDSVLSTYPRFKSYQSNLEITGLADHNVRYVGGFSLTGNKVSSTSFTGEPSRIEVSRNDKLMFTAHSPNFVFSPSGISATRASINIVQGNDSIVHKAVRLKYTYSADTIQRLLLQKDKGNMRNTPYSSSFFSLDFAADVIQWDLAADSLNLMTEGGRSTMPLIIESLDYYDPEDYRFLSGIGFGFHPVTLAATYCLRNGVMDFYSGDLAQYANKDPMVVKKAMEFLFEKGLVNYDARRDRVYVKQKLVDLYRAFKGQLDYDNIKIHSVIDTLPNATLNFKDRYMAVRGVEEFDVSDSLKVHIKPDSSVITILQGRDIKFDGTISAGNFEISGKGFTLRYDSFLIDLQHIDSINFYVTEKNSRGQEVRRKVSNSMVGADSIAAAAGGMLNRVEQKSGTLFISKADNKSGKEKVPNYPRLDASGGGVIYFDRPEVLGGVYDRSIFFVVPPFKLDSLNDADPAAINFDGTFVSSGIFPSFKEKLHTQPDKSLGFDHTIPAEGYQLYKGDGKVTGALTMTNRGLRGWGEIEFLAARVGSQDFIFYPDSVVTRGNRASITETQFGSVLFPQASLSDFEMKWYPRQDKMFLKNQKAPFNFYDSTAQLQGTVMISKGGVAGSGKLDTRGTELISRDMKFNGNDFAARHARFKVNTTDPTKPLFTGNDVRLKFNLKENYADLSPEVEGVAAIDFPYAEVKTSIQKARWDLDEQKIFMNKDPNTPIEHSYFYTTRKELDSLYFNADRAEYNLKTQELKVGGIPYIIVADAKITPENNEVLILENARIGTLKNTTIVLDTLDGYHLLTEGVVDIISRKEFTGYATYQYINFLKDTFAIKMKDFQLKPIAQQGEGRPARGHHSNATMQTVATGAVGVEDSLVLGAGLFYKGDMIMYATRPALELDGYVKLNIRNIKNYNAWIQYRQSGDETDVALDFNNAVTEEGKKATAGLHLGSVDHQLYITFVNDKKMDEDEDFFTPEGALFYDTETKEYRIEDKEKAAGHKLSGKVFAYNDEKQTVKFEGPVHIMNGTKDFNVKASVIGTGDLPTNEFKMNALVMVDSNVPPTAFDVMANALVEVIKNEGPPEGLGDQTDLLYKIADVVGERMVKEYEEKSLQGYVPLSTLPELAKPLVFSDVNFKWHPKLKAFYSEGLLGMSHIGRADINAAFEGFMEVKRTEDGVPVFHVFIKASPEQWYYFGFEDNRLLVFSSNNDFNQIISKKTNAGKVKIGEIAFVPGSEDETLAFVNRFRKQYLGIDTPYNLGEGSQAVKKKDEKKQEDDDGF